MANVPSGVGKSPGLDANVAARDLNAAWVNPTTTRRGASTDNNMDVISDNSTMSAA